MSKDKPKPAMDFIVAFLKENPTAPYAEVKAGAEQRGLQVFPIMFGRAQAMLGLVEVAPRGARKQRQLEGMESADRMARSIEPGSLEGLVTTIRQSEQQRIRYRRALERVSAILREVLA